MKKIEGQIVVTRDGLLLRGRETFHQKCVNEFLGKEDRVIVKVVASQDEPYKTYNQLGYFFNEICEKAIIGYKNWGQTVRERRTAAGKLCLDLDFVEYIEDAKGDIIATIPLSISRMSVKVMTDLVEKSSIFVRVDMGIDVATPDEWFKGQKLR
jgi:hypothetical protein